MRDIKDIMGEAPAGSCAHEPEVSQRWQWGDCYPVETSCPALDGHKVGAVNARIEGEDARAYLLFADGGTHAVPIGSLVLMEGGDHSVAIDEAHRGLGLGSALIAEGMWDAFVQDGAPFDFTPATRYTEGGHAAFSRAAEVLVGWGVLVATTSWGTVNAIESRPSGYSLPGCSGATTTSPLCPARS